MSQEYKVLGNSKAMVTGQSTAQSPEETLMAYPENKNHTSSLKY